MMPHSPMKLAKHQTRYKNHSSENDERDEVCEYANHSEHHGNNREP